MQSQRRAGPACSPHLSAKLHKQGDRRDKPSVRGRAPRSGCRPLRYEGITGTEDDERAAHARGCTAEAQRI